MMKPATKSKIGSVLATIAEVRKQTASAVVFVSFGKDSLALLDLLYPRFDRLVCVFMYFVKDLEHINRFLRYCRKRYPRAEWVQVPHWNLTYIYRAGMYCEPKRDIKLKKLSDVIAEVREATGLKWVFLGMKKADSLNRRLMLMGLESSHYTNNGLAYPLAELTNRDVIAYTKAAKLPAPVIYAPKNGKASNGIGFNADCFLWLRENCPGDLEKIYAEFPLSKRILFEYERQSNKQ